MSGHSHWATIKRRKGAADAKRGQAFSKCAKALMLAARKGTDPNMNLALRYALDEARAVNMPKDSIERAIKKGAGELEGQQLQEVTYEAYGQAGVAILIEVVTDNRNRTSSEISKIVERHGGRMGQPNSVAWMFSTRGIIMVSGFKDEERVMDVALGAGAEDLSPTDDGFEVVTPIEALEAVKKALEAAQIPVARSELAQRPQNYISLGESDARKILGLMEAIEEHDDVQKVHSNFDVPVEIIEKLQAE
ncbi:MAG: YebC/PmpR family DNA-binding transcriptional regulator [Planctomycetes bacterium]|nr:YebC/PmpR family DNA-binding transcriptional regulator [Planctomycetota bacterium]